MTTHLLLAQEPVVTLLFLLSLGDVRFFATVDLVATGSVFDLFLGEIRTADACFLRLADAVTLRLSNEYRVFTLEQSAALVADGSCEVEADGRRVRLI